MKRLKEVTNSIWKTIRPGWLLDRKSEPEPFVIKRTGIELSNMSADNDKPGMYQEYERINKLMDSSPTVLKKEEKQAAYQAKIAEMRKKPLPPTPERAKTQERFVVPVSNITIPKLEIYTNIHAQSRFNGELRKEFNNFSITEKHENKYLAKCAKYLNRQKTNPFDQDYPSKINKNFFKAIASLPDGKEKDMLGAHANVFFQVGNSYKADAAIQKRLEGDIKQYQENYMNNINNHYINIANK